MGQVVYSFCFVLYLLSFQYKFAHPFFGTGVFIFGLPLLVHGWSAYYAIKMGRGSDCFSLWCWIGLSILILTSPLYHQIGAGNPKVFWFLFMVMPAYLWGFLVLGRQERVQRLFFLNLGGAAILVSIWATVQLVMTGHLNELMGNNYLVSGQTMGIGTIMLTIVIFHQSRPWSWSVVIGLLLGLLSFNGGRGPLLMAVITLVLCGIHYRHRVSLKGHMGGAFLGYVIFFFLFAYVFDHTPEAIERTTRAVLAPASDASTTTRLTYYRDAINLFLRYPITGVGFGHWTFSAGYDDPTLHPHNLFLEVGSELGLFGLLCLMGVIWPLAKGFKGFLFMGPTPQRVSHPPLLESLVFFLGLFCFLNAMKTGDMGDNLLLFFFIGIFSAMILARNDENR